MANLLRLPHQKRSTNALVNLLLRDELRQTTRIQSDNRSRLPIGTKKLNSRTANNVFIFSNRHRHKLIPRLTFLFLAPIINKFNWIPDQHLGQSKFTIKQSNLQQNVQIYNSVLLYINKKVSPVKISFFQKNCWSTQLYQNQKYYCLVQYLYYCQLSL